jgi:aspartate-semialdehyde dehydrogenase
MPSTSDRHSQKIVIAGASSLLGNEVKMLLEESHFATWDLRLVDEEVVAGTLTEASGEATIIQQLEEDTFRGARYAFLTGSTAFGKQCLAAAKEAGVRVIDFTHASLEDPDAAPWFPRLEALSGRRLDKKARVFSVCSAAGTAVSTLLMSLRNLGLQNLIVVLFEPVSEAGREGIEELETQTSQLLSFQNVGSPVFGTQAAFNLLPCYGEESRRNLHANLLQIRAEVSGALGDSKEDCKLALNLVHAPVFYGMTFSAYAQVPEKTEQAALIDACKEAGFALIPAKEPGPSNVSVAGETSVFLQVPMADSARAGGWWFWGAVDNLRLPAWSGCKLAEWLEEE